MQYKIIPNNTISVHNGDDSLYHIIPSGFEDKYLVVDGGPHFNGDTEYMTPSELKTAFGLVITHEPPTIHTQQEIDNWDNHMDN